VQEGKKSIIVTMKNGYEENTRCIYLSFLSFLILVPVSELVVNNDESTFRSSQDDWVRCKPLVLTHYKPGNGQKVYCLLGLSAD